MKTCVIAIPIYKEELNNWEKLSVNMCMRQDLRMDVWFISPKDLETDWYRLNYPEFKIVTYKGWDGTIASYNKMTLSKDFYSCFLEYEYVLIYQTDALLLKPVSEILKFIDLGYDYIGAPWLEFEYEGGREVPKYVLPKWKKWRCIHSICKVKRCMVGNGGFSLRKVSAMKRLMCRHKFRILFWTGNEDVFIGYYGTPPACEIKIAPVNVAKEFSLESCIEKEYKLGIRPLGIHGWQKYAKEFVIRDILGDIGHEM